MNAITASKCSIILLPSKFYHHSTQSTQCSVFLARETKKDDCERHSHGRCFFGWAEEPPHTSNPAHAPHRSQQHENQTNSAAGPRVLTLRL
eukprot:404194-Ditylum_brightwellii.AAC.1